MKRKVFRSRISILLTAFTLTLLISALIQKFQEGIYTEVYMFSGVILFVVLLFAGMRYVISGDKLFVKIFWFIPSGSAKITDIAEVKRSYNPLSSPAGSMKRLQITFVSGRVWLISPAREKEFIEELKAVNPRTSTNVHDKKGIWRILNWDI